jgi:predicted metal-dependent hydrolase
MKTITINNTPISYIVRRTTTKKIYIRVKNDVVVVSATKFTTIKEIEELLYKHEKFILENLIKREKEEIIHLNGVSYIPKFHIGLKNKVEIIGDEIHIHTKKMEYDLQKKTIHNFYKTEVEKVLTQIIYDAMTDFKEINFPTISVLYMKSMFGNYNRKKHHVKISSMLAKYDYKYIKYILYHELSHALEFNHSKEFFRVFESKYHNVKLVRKELKKIKYNDYI